MSGLVEEDKDWNFGDIPLSRSVDVCMSLRAYFTVIKTLCRDLSLTVPDNPKDVFQLAL